MVKAIISIAILFTLTQSVFGDESQPPPIPSELEGVITLYVRDKATPPSDEFGGASALGGLATLFVGLMASDEIVITGLTISSVGLFVIKTGQKARHQAIRDTDAYKEAMKIFRNDEKARDFVLDLKSRYDLARLVKKYTPEKFHREVIGIIRKEREEFDRILPKDLFPYAKTRAEVLDAIAGKRALYWLAAQNASTAKRQQIEKFLEDEKTAVTRYIANRNATPHATAEKYPFEETHGSR